MNTHTNRKVIVGNTIWLTRGRGRPRPIYWLSRKERRFARAAGWKAEIPGTYECGRILGRWVRPASSMMRPDGSCCGFLCGIMEIRRAFYASLNGTQ